MKKGLLTILVFLLFGVFAFWMGYTMYAVRLSMQNKSFPLEPIGFSQEWKTAYEAGDFEALRDMYEPDARLMTRDRAAKNGIDEIIEYFEKSRQTGAKFEIDFEPELVRLDFPYYFQISKWWLQGTNAEGVSFEDSGRSLVIFKKSSDNSKWRIWMDIDNHTPDVTFDTKPESQE